ncbi:flagellar basal body rod protein FlgB [Azovibrio restrictus]|uniref:flagellar basal body rod protein FlgB n=1 Tax=Azovibrio restrictus TaxID=146938 RepID=UPI0026EFF122|nr:flagellar basal body rod protein FlgB [Azovibrio restrictus]MDD3481923.1 flagellar basal body rod protein FlgB [Azovibrio restrictus]
MRENKMIGDIKAHLGTYTEALNLRAYRQQVLASNIANADTPHYKARDFDFTAAFEAAMGKRESQGSVGVARTHPGHMGGLDAGLAHVNLQYRSETQSAVDGNTVDMDVERAQIADNSLQYQILTQFLSDKISGLRTAISSNQG